MACGRVKDHLQVFGNDYPTPYVIWSASISLDYRNLLFINRDGTCVRDYLHVLDLAAGHLLALDALGPNSKVFDNCPDEARFKAYNLGKGKGMSVLEIVKAMEEATGFKYEYTIIGRRYVYFFTCWVRSDIIVIQPRWCTRSHRRPQTSGRGIGLQSTAGLEDDV